MDILSLFGIGLIGFIAQMVDGTLGMGYGVTSASILISLGVMPPVASASVHTAELFVTFISGASHFKLGNVRKDLLIPLISFGIIGGIIGACGLVKLPPKPVKLVVGTILFSMGAIIFYRFMFRYKNFNNSEIKQYPVNKLRTLGFFAAFFDALGGGGWGPICTPTLVVTGTEPSKAVGSVNLAEFFVTVAISSTFLVLMGPTNFRWDMIIAILIGGAIAAPIAAFNCKRMPKRLLGVLVGIIVIILSLRILLR